MTTPTGTGGPRGPTTPETHHRTVETHETHTVERPTSRVSWSGIFVGAILTLAVGLTMLALGAGLGLTAVDPAALDLGTVGWGTGFWSILTVIIATFIGAFVSVKASSLRRHSDAAVQGASVWGLSFLFMGFLAVIAGMAGAAMALPDPAAAAAEIGVAASWGYFIAAVLGAASGVLGGMAAYPAKKVERAREERRREERAGPPHPGEPRPSET